MSIQFNADEIFEMAEQIERNGARFYRTVAEKAPGPQSHQVLLDLAAMEEEHEKTFASIRDDLSEQERVETLYDPYGEAVLYLRAFADGHVFNVKAGPTELLTGRETMEEILQTAIGLEKDSIVFYLGIKDMVPESLGKDRIDTIIREEMSHVTKLSDQLTTLKQQ